MVNEQMVLLKKKFLISRITRNSEYATTFEKDIIKFNSALL